jgi:prophage regulatory protein
MPKAPPAQPVTLLRIADVVARVGLSRTVVYEREAAGDFPRRVSLGPRCVAWRSDEIERWILSRTPAPPGGPVAARLLAARGRLPEAA